MKKRQENLTPLVGILAGNGSSYINLTNSLNEIHRITMVMAAIAWAITTKKILKPVACNYFS
jgi:hypothetical protein